MVNIVERFLKSVREGKNGCIEWTGTKDDRGYGTISATPRKNLKKNIKAYRLSYRLFNGKLQRGLVIDHICRNKSCVNPKHLRQVSYRDNIINSDSCFATNARKTICKRGHSLMDKDNLLKSKNNTRHCKKCFYEYHLPKYRKKLTKR